MPHLIDELDESGQPTGRRISINEAEEKGLWHAGVRGLVYSPDGHVLVEKRAHEMIQYPDMLDLSLGGFVDTGERPKEAMARELREELGIAVDPSLFVPVGVTKYNHHWVSHGKKVSRAFIHAYLIPVPNADIPLKTQDSEVEWAGFVKLSHAKELVAHKHPDPLGRLTPIYAYFQTLIEALEKHLKAVG